MLGVEFRRGSLCAAARHQCECQNKDASHGGSIQHQPFQSSAEIGSNCPDTTTRCGRILVGVFARLLRHAVRLLGSGVAKARSAGADALIFRMTTLRAPAQTGVAVRRHRERRRSLLVAPSGGGLGAGHAHGPLRCQGGSRQQRRNYNTNDKTHEATPFSVLTSTHKGLFRMQCSSNRQ